MIKVISFKICPFVQRVTALLEAKNSPYEVEYIDLNHKPDWFTRISPNGQVPLLVTESGEVLFESDAIVEYLEETLPNPLFSSNPVTKAQERAWSYLATKHYLVQCSAQRSKDKQTLLERSDKLSKALTKLEKKLVDDPFLELEGLGMVAVAWLPLLHRAAIIEAHSGYDFIGQLPQVKSLQQSLLGTGLGEKSVAADFEAKFTAFYLSDQTYLGQCTKFKLGEACCGESECKDEDFNCCS